jgi:hypothetical protein
VAASNAHSEGRLVNKDIDAFRHHIPQPLLIRLHIRELEEKERTRRLNDSDEVYAMLNAFLVRDIMLNMGWPLYRQANSFDKCHRWYATTLLEENERRCRIRTHLLHLHQQQQQPAQLMDIVATNLNKFTFTTSQATHFFKDIASKLGAATAQVTSSFSEKTKEFARSTLGRVRAVAGDITHFSVLMYVLALEERERLRRINDADEVTAIVNAWNQSALIRDLEYLYRPNTTHLAIFPARYLEEQERRWRINQDDTQIRANAQAVAKIVIANAGRFEHATRSRLNPNAPAFVPHSTAYGADSVTPTFHPAITPIGETTTTTVQEKVTVERTVNQAAGAQL